MGERLWRGDGKGRTYAFNAEGRELVVALVLWHLEIGVGGWVLAVAAGPCLDSVDVGGLAVEDVCENYGAEGDEGAWDGGGKGNEKAEVRTVCEIKLLRRSC